MEKEETKQFDPEKFAEKYQAFCQEEGGVIVGRPRFAATNHGTFELVVDLVPVPLKK